MRQQFPEGSGGVYEVPGVGRVIGGEPFDYPELISACVPVEGGQDDADEPAEDAAPDDPQEDVETAEDASVPPGETENQPRAKGTRR